MKSTEIIKKIDILEDKLIEVGKKEFKKSGVCPFKKNHYFLSQRLDGLGKYKWNCPICGEEFCE